MSMIKGYTAAAAALSMLTWTATAMAETAEVSFTRLAGTTAEGTTIYRADLSSLTFSEIYSLTLVDSNSRIGGSAGAFSGFDLDAIKLSSTFASTASGAVAAAGLPVFDFSAAGTLFAPGTQRLPAAAKLNGTDASGRNVDAGFATLGMFDAIWFGTGSVTLGDGGTITFTMNAPVQSAGRYAYIGEVGNSAGEGIAGTMFVSALPVPEPSAWAMLLAGLMIAPALLRRKAS